eukprot:5209075-Pyramimonas_sp.AAC.1
MEYWLGMVWSEHRIWHWHSLRQCKRGDEGNVTRSEGGQTRPQENMVKRDLKRAIIEDRKLYRCVCCTCPSFSDHRLGCPMRRPSRSPNFKGTPLVWYHGDGRGHCTDPGKTPYRERLHVKR